MFGSSTNRMTMTTALTLSYQLLYSRLNRCLTQNSVSIIMGCYAICSINERWALKRRGEVYGGRWFRQVGRTGEGRRKERKKLLDFMSYCDFLFTPAKIYLCRPMRIARERRCKIQLSYWDRLSNTWNYILFAYRTRNVNKHNKSTIKLDESS